MHDAPPPTPLMTMLRGVVGESIGYLVLADWIDEHLNRGDLAGILRRSVPGPPPPFEEPVTFSMRFQTLDEMTMLYLGRYDGAERPLGYLICLGTSGTRRTWDAPVVRWVRWLPDSSKDDIDALWEQSSEQP